MGYDISFFQSKQITSIRKRKQQQEKRSLPHSRVTTTKSSQKCERDNPLYESSSKRPQTSDNSSRMNVETDINLTKKKRIVFWIYLMAIAGYLISVIVMVANSYDPSSKFVKSDDYYYAYQVAKQWQLGFITDVVIVNGSSLNCPANYQNAFTFLWSGSNFGCYCNFSGNLSFVLEGYCSPGLIQKNCSNMPNQQSKTASNWAQSSRICIKRSSVSFNTEQKYSSSLKKCGSSQSLIIMPSTEPCPVVNISFTAFSLEDHVNTATDALGLLSTLYLSSNSTSPYSFYAYPAIKFAVSQYQFCQMNEDSGLTPNHSDFVVLKIARGCQRLGNYTILDYMSEINFYQYNSNLQGLTSLTGFPHPGNWQYYLGFASTTGWTYRCRHNFNNKYSIPNAISMFSFSYSTQYNSFLIGISICLIVILIQISVLTLRRIVNSAVYPVGYKQKNLPRHFLMAMMRYIIDFLSKLGILGVSLGNQYLIYTNYNWFKSAINLNCADNNIMTLQNILNPFLILYSSLFNYTLTIIVLTIVMLIVDVAHFIYIYRAELNFYLIESAGVQLVKDDDLDWVKQQDKENLMQPKQIQINLHSNKQQNDQFRITMVDNIFAKQDQDRPKIVNKKKKKKFSPFKRNKDQDKGDKEAQSQEIKDIFDDFNPYQDQSLDKLQSPPPKSSNRLQKRRRKK